MRSIGPAGATRAILSPGLSAGGTIQSRLAGAAAERRGGESCPKLMEAPVSRISRLPRRASARGRSKEVRLGARVSIMQRSLESFSAPRDSREAAETACGIAFRQSRLPAAGAFDRSVRLPGEAEDRVAEPGETAEESGDGDPVGVAHDARDTLAGEVVDLELRGREVGAERVVLLRGAGRSPFFGVGVFDDLDGPPPAAATGAFRLEGPGDCCLGGF